jgi:hypothetical protein
MMLEEKYKKKLMGFHFWESMCSLNMMMLGEQKKIGGRPFSGK